MGAADGLDPRIAGDRIVIVGASLAGLRAAEALRAGGYDGAVVLVGAEHRLPYDRPPLSKQVLAGDWEPERTQLRDDYDDLNLDLRLGRRAVALDPDARVVTLDDGARLDYDGLVIATGAIPRTLPDTPPLAGIHTLRTLDDALAIRDEATRARRLVVVGAGFIGSEVAATCTRRGLAVTVLEAADVPLVRGLGPVLGATLAALHRDHGVDLRTGTGVAALEGTARVERVRLADGNAVEADLVVVGVGVSPAVDWLEGSGLTLDDGVVCDATCVAAPGVVVAGDVCRWPNLLFDGELMRLEHWTNAADQGAAAARRLLVRDEDAEPYAPVPYVWSDQYDTKIQVLGHVRGDDEIRVVHGSLAERRFVAVVGREGRLVGAVGFSRPAVIARLYRLVADRASLDDAIALVEAGVTGPR